jgi:hypothetical protein
VGDCYLLRTTAITAVRMYLNSFRGAGMSQSRQELSRVTKAKAECMHAVPTRPDKMINKWSIFQ